MWTKKNGSLKPKTIGGKEISGQERNERSRPAD